MKAGEFQLNASFNGKGQAFGKFEFLYQLNVNKNISNTISGIGGGEELSFEGYGFGQNMEILVCYNISGVDPLNCKLKQFNDTFATCITPSVIISETKIISNECGIMLTLNEEVAVAPFSLTYNFKDTPIISSVSPSIGGTAGGTLISIKGTGFNGTADEANITIGGSLCAISEYNSTLITCTTGAITTGGQFEIEIVIQNLPRSVTLGDAYFNYIDRWYCKFYPY